MRFEICVAGKMVWLSASCRVALIQSGEVLLAFFEEGTVVHFLETGGPVFGKDS